MQECGTDCGTEINCHIDEFAVNYMYVCIYIYIMCVCVFVCVHIYVMCIYSVYIRGPVQKSNIIQNVIIEINTININRSLVIILG